MKWLIFLIFLVASPSANAVWDVAICSGCSSSSQYEAAAVQAAGTDFNGERQILVINPETNGSRHVLVTHTPPGEDPRSGSGAPPTPIQYVTRGTAIPLQNDVDRRIIYADDLLERPSSSSATSWSTTSQEKAEIGSLIEFGRNEFVIVLPENDLFGSFNSRNEPAVAIAIHGAMTEKNAGWAIRQLGTRVRQLIQNRLKVYFGKSFSVCAIFNNGDSACFKPDVATPSAEYLIEGSVKNRQGNPIGGSGGGGGMAVEHNPPNTGYGPIGSTGGSGEAWLFCAFVGDKLDSCWIQIL